MREMQESYSPDGDEAAAVPRRKLDADDDDEVCVPEPRERNQQRWEKGGSESPF